MSQLQQTITSCLTIGLVVGVLLSTIVSTAYHRTAAMEYGDGQVLMLLLDTYPALTSDARESLLKYLSDGYITRWEYDIIMWEATRAVFYNRGDVSMGRQIKNPC